MSYDDLTEVEKAHLDEYRNLRSISDWPGFTQRQRQRKDECREFIERRRNDIRQAMEDDPKNNKRLNRQARLNALSDDELARGGARRQTELPASNCTPTEKALIEEREFFFAVAATTPSQKARKAQNRRELAKIRMTLWGLLQNPREEKNNKRLKRESRWKHLCVATKKGSPYVAWKKTHNVKTGDLKTVESKPPMVKGSATRNAIISWHHAHAGITEDPPNSNCDNRKDGIRHAQIQCADGGSWLLYTPWCGEWTHEGYRVAGIEVGSWMASVASIEDHARAGLGPFKYWTSGFTTNAKPGDAAVVGGRGVHVATIEEVTPTGYWTREGNTSPGTAGSQSNGGWSGRRFRPASSIHGVAHLAAA